MPEHLPQIEESTKFNFFTSIWIVPLIALLIASWLAYQYYAQLGPKITIVFPSNQGLKAGQSLIKYKDVPVGVVKKITLQKEGDGVVVIAQMDKVAEPFLNKDTKFWIVKPELGISGISGLETLVSGNYIGISAKKGGEFQSTFVGLDHAFRSDKNGAYFVLRSSAGESSVKQGTPVYLKNIMVGSVEYVMLGLNDLFVDIIIFIDKAYIPYVHTDSKFWVRSTLDAELLDGTLDVNVAPVTDLLQGAIEFSSSGYESSRSVPDNFTFLLYKNKNRVSTKKIGKREKEMEDFLLYTEDSLSKLKIGSPVKYEDFTIGSVKEIRLSYDKQTHHLKGRVHVKIDMSVFDDLSDANDSGKENFYIAVREGLRARIDTTDPLTQRLYVNLLFSNTDGNRSIEEGEPYASLPTISSVNGDIMGGLSKIIEKVNALPMKALLENVNRVVEESKKPVAQADEVLKALETTVKNLNRLTNKPSFARMPDEVDKALKALTNTLKTTQKVLKGYGTHSLLNRQLSETLKTVNETSLEMRDFLKMLNRKPDSLIFGDK